MNRTTCMAAACLVLAACANRPETIRASYVSHERFMDLDCPTLLRQLDDSRNELANLSKAQNEKANADAAGVFLLGIPFSKLSGDYEGEIARLKGQVEAIETAQVKKKCSGSLLPGTAVGTPGPPLAAPPRQSTEPAQRQMDQLQDLRAQGLLTEEEFEAKRKRVAESAPAGTGTAPAAPETAPRPPIVGVRLKLRDQEAVSHVKTGDVVLTVDSVSNTGTILNGGAIVLDRSGVVVSGSPPIPHIAGLGGGRLRPGVTVVARMVPSAPAEAIDLEVRAIRQDTLRIADRDIEVFRCAVSGYAPQTIVPGVGMMNSAAGARIAGEVAVEPHSGLVLSADIRSVNTFYALSRRALAPEAP